MAVFIYVTDCVDMILSRHAWLKLGRAEMITLVQITSDALPIATRSRFILSLFLHHGCNSGIP